MNRIPAVTSTLSMARKFCSVSRNAVCGEVRCGAAAVRRGGDILGRGRVAQVRTLRAARRDGKRVMRKHVSDHAHAPTWGKV